MGTRVGVILALVCSLVAIVAFAQAQEVERFTISTFYPSPYGTYKILKLQPVPSDQKPVCDASQAGTMYYDDEKNKPLYCNGTEWVSFDRNALRVQGGILASGSWGCGPDGRGWPGPWNGKDIGCLVGGKVDVSKINCYSNSDLTCRQLCGWFWIPFTGGTEVFLTNRNRSQEGISYACRVLGNWKVPEGETLSYQGGRDGFYFDCFANADVSWGASAVFWLAVGPADQGN